MTHTQCADCRQLAKELDAVRDERDHLLAEVAQLRADSVRHRERVSAYVARLLDTIGRLREKNESIA